MSFRLILGLMFLVVVSASGCAATRQQSSESQLQIRVAQLERKLEERDQEIDDLKDQVREVSSQIDTVSSDPSSIEETVTRDAAGAASEYGDIIRVSASAQEVQRALKKAGYYNGAIDGKIGSGSKKAIADFQKDHSLTSDGVVGKKTWMALKSYLGE